MVLEIRLALGLLRQEDPRGRCLPDFVYLDGIALDPGAEDIVDGGARCGGLQRARTGVGAGHGVTSVEKGRAVEVKMQA